MNNEQELLTQLTRIADALERLASNDKAVSPNIVRPIEEFRSFDWAGHQIEVVKSDNDGPTHVSYNGTVFTRRSPVNKFEPAIWYSASAGKDEDGNVLYIKLITFRTIGDADPLPPKAIGKTNSGSAPRPAQPAPKSATPQTPAALKFSDPKIVVIFAKEWGGTASEAAQTLFALHKDGRLPDTLSEAQAREFAQGFKEKIA
jgi:hypothetical protein